MSGRNPDEPLRFGLLLPNAGYYADARRVVDLARAAEESGWDGVFLWDHLMLDRRLRLPVADTWTVVTAVLAGTRRILSGPVVTPLASRQPWKVARETVTLDYLSEGRLVLGVGLGAAQDTDFSAFGDDVSLAERAARVDEALTVIQRLWSGQEVSHAGERFCLDRVTFLPTPLRPPRVPVWTAATWPARGRGALDRAARWDGIVPMARDRAGGLRGPTAEELTEVLTAVGPTKPGWAVAVPGRMAPAYPVAARDYVRNYHGRGATWWLESFDPWSRDPREAHDWAVQGPPG
ncbi:MULTISPECIES: LLM class flavin-dependent oxidoreductase [unclassified Streptomyces]|jgi:alkanesulfonate monooxygenase SsuD/methylene tetrahydromethanopterin reductase-like flavin-dependent oxidoreductase (luciferase family)|uniref:LLM class flavin-dependent oxidoreductase n=1 Tax=unclassified Streptomyces TaxID=2593676 RepID=UPI0033AFC632